MQIDRIINLELNSNEWVSYFLCKIYFFNSLRLLCVNSYQYGINFFFLTMKVNIKEKILLLNDGILIYDGKRAL